MTGLPKLCFVLAIGTAIVSVPAAAVQNGPSQSNLNAKLIALPSGGTAVPTFEIELRNSGSQDLILNLGIMLANGKQQFADAIHLSIREGGPGTQTLDLDLKGPPYVAGRIDPFIVPLPKGGSMTLPINLSDYWIPKQKLHEVHLKPGRYYLSAEYRGENIQMPNLDMKGMGLMTYWLGRATAREIPFVVSEK
jgi:hypothetical protein